MEKNKSKLTLGLQIAVIILTLVAVGNGIKVLDEIKRADYTSGTTIKNMEYRLEDKNFERIDEWIVAKEATQSKITSQERALGNVGKYYYQALHYYALEAAGIERASDYKERMEETKAGLGEYENQAGVIDEILKNQ
ncbi:MAG: hypothetical protein J6Y09_06970 [Lachnospiraceae bacterium]|nr:hypothetical protein [Lachnospiraceae bacterium]